MKNVLFIILSMMISSCETDKNGGVTISVLEDVTENDFQSKPQYQNFQSTFSLNEDIWLPATFRYGVLNDLHHNSRTEISLEGEVMLLGNEIQRRGRINQFYDSIQKILNTSSDSKVYRHSSIWRPLVEELKILQGQGSAVLYVFSDLAENSELFSIHNSDDMNRLQHSPEQVREEFLAVAKGLNPSSGNLKIVIVYQPNDRKEDLAFSKMKIFYRSLYQELSIPISFVTNP